MVARRMGCLSAYFTVAVCSPRRQTVCSSGEAGREVTFGFTRQGDIQFKELPASIRGLWSFTNQERWYKLGSSGPIACLRF